MQLHCTVTLVFRTVSDELMAREEDELLDTADDVKGFLQNKKNRRDIPKYIDRANVVAGIVHECSVSFAAGEECIVMDLSDCQYVSGHSWQICVSGR
jgi:hypothetical protein